MGREPVDEFSFDIPVNYQATFDTHLPLPSPPPNENWFVLVGDGKSLWVPILETEWHVIPVPPLYVVSPVSESRAYKLTAACREDSAAAFRYRKMTIAAETGSGSYMAFSKEIGVSRVVYTNYHYTISFQSCSNQKVTVTLIVAPDCRTVGNCPR